MDSGAFEFGIHSNSSVLGFKNPGLYVENHDVCGKSGSQCK